MIDLNRASGQLSAALGADVHSVEVHATTHAADGTASSMVSATAGD